MDELPLEVIEKILEKLRMRGDTDDDDDSSDRKTMFNVRLVNSRWRDAMENVMEQKILASRTKWNVLRYYNSFPTLYKWLRMDGSRHVCIPQSMVKLNDRNPFITRSLYICDSRDYNQPGWNIFSSEKFFTEWGHGQLVTNFKSHYSIPPKEMYELLKMFPNLKALGAAISIIKKNDKETSILMKKSLPPLPNLKILELWCPKPVNEYRDYFRWYYNAYGGQVMHLNLAGESLPALRIKNCKSSGVIDQKMFQKLQRLKVCMPGGIFFKKTLSNIPLTHLSIEHYEKPMSLKGIKVISDFINMFAKTLIKLHLDVDLGGVNWEKCHVPAPPPPPLKMIKFPRLVDFAYNLPENKHENELLKSWFLGRFPKIKTVQMLSYHNHSIQEILHQLGCNLNEDRENEMRKYFKMIGFWTAAPRLEKVLLTVCPKYGDNEQLEIYRHGVSSTLDISQDKT